MGTCTSKPPTNNLNEKVGVENTIKYTPPSGSLNEKVSVENTIKYTPPSESFNERMSVDDRITIDIVGKSLDEMALKYKPIGYFIWEDNGLETYRPNRIRVRVENGIITKVCGRG